MFSKIGALLLAVLMIAAPPSQALAGQEDESVQSVQETVLVKDTEEESQKEEETQTQEVEKKETKAEETKAGETETTEEKPVQISAGIQKKLDSAAAGTKKILKKTGDKADWEGSCGWILLGMARYDLTGRNTAFRDQAIAYASGISIAIGEKGSEKLSSTRSTDNSRAVIALTAAGYDAQDFGGKDLTQPLLDLDFVKKQGINGPIWALTALDCRGSLPAYEKRKAEKKDDAPKPYAEDEASYRDDLIRCILEAEKGGGWSFGGKSPDVDMTCMALTALAPYRESRADVKEAVSRALTWLSGQQKSDGSFASGDTKNSESASQVITALTSLGIDPFGDSRFLKNGRSPVDSLLDFALEDGGFRHIQEEKSYNVLASMQAYYALAACRRFEKGKSSLFDMSDQEVTMKISILKKKSAKSPSKPSEKKTKSEKKKSSSVSRGKRLLPSAPAGRPGRMLPWGMNGSGIAGYPGDPRAGYDAGQDYDEEDYDDEDYDEDEDYGDEDVDEDEDYDEEDSDGEDEDIDGEDGEDKTGRASGSPAVSKAADQKAKRVISRIRRALGSRPREELTVSDIKNLTDAYGAYLKLTDEEKESVRGSDVWSSLSAITARLGRQNHTESTSGASLLENDEKSLPWYVRLVAKPAKMTADMENKLKDQIGSGGKVYDMYDIYLVDTLTGEKWEPENVLNMSLPAPSGSGGNLLILHIKEKGSAEWISPKPAKDADGKSILKFKASAFSIYGPVRSDRSVKELISLAGKDEKKNRVIILLSLICAAAALAAFYAAKKLGAEQEEEGK